VGIALKEPGSRVSSDGAFAGPSDYATCRQLHRKYGATYYFASRRFRAEARQRTHALYAFVRIPDEWVDNPAGLSLEQRVGLLRNWRSQLLRGMDGVPPNHPAMRAFCDVVRETEMPLEEPLCFLDAMEQDLSVGRYETYSDLRDYMRGSAAAVGLMMCHVLGAPRTPKVDRAASALGEAMQLTNFLRDVGEDAKRGRIYLPLEDLATFEVRESEIMEGQMSPGFKNLMQFEIARARALYKEADSGIPLLPADSRKAVKLARLLYARILDRIEARNFDVFTGRARTSGAEKLFVALQVMLGKT
jgi:phytoene synthase